MAKNNNNSQNKIKYSIWDTKTEKNHTIPTSPSETVKRKNEE